MVLKRNSNEKPGLKNEFQDLINSIFFLNYSWYYMLANVDQIIGFNGL